MSPIRRRLLILAAGAAGAAALAGCTTLNAARVEVRSFGTWPADRKPGGTFVFDRLPSQQGSADRQSRLEDAALPALRAAGFTPAADKASAQVLVQLSAQSVQVRGEGYSGTSVYMRSDWFWARHGGFWGPGFGLEYQPALYEQRVAVLVRDRKTGDVLHEASGGMATYGAVESNWPVLFEAVLKDFPGPAISPRVVVIPMGGEPAPAAASAPERAPGR